MSSHRSNKTASNLPSVEDDFQFILEDKEMDEGQLHSFEVLQILKGDLEPLNLYTEDIAYNNLDYKMIDLNDPQVGKLIKTQQLAAQYLKYKLDLNQKKTQMFHEFTQKECQNEAQLKQFKSKQDEMLHDLERRNENADYLLSMHDEGLKKQR